MFATATRSSTTASSVTKEDIGLFSIPHLHKPSDFAKLASQAMTLCDSLRKTLHSEIDIPIQTSHRAMEVLYMLDSISKEVCNVIDAAELCRCVHTDQQWQESATHAFSKLSDYIAQLNADTTLYEALTQVTTSKVFTTLSEEQQRFASLLKVEFERHGIHLSTEQRDHVRQLQSHVVQLETLFQHNITNTTQYFNVQADWVEEVIPRHVIEANTPQLSTRSSNQLTLSTDPSFANALIRHSPNPALRKQVYMETHTSCPDNVAVLDALRRVRHELSVQQGFNSYAERSLRDNMAQHPSTVAQFLHRLERGVAQRYQQDMTRLTEAKRKVEQTSDALEPWDVPFYTAIQKASRGLDSNYVAEHLTLSQCIDGMKILVHSLFGITMIEVEMEPKERWDDVSKKFLFRDESQQPLGTMYLDPHPRPGKYSHAAHFVVRCGCSLGVDSTEYQLPVVALVCNIQSSTLLSHSEVETVFHEFGHALHSLLSRTTYQHLSGTRSALDFVETPSQLMEHFVWDPTFVKIIGRHHQTGEPLPDDTIQQLLQSRNEFRAVEVVNQIVYARYDQALFGVPTTMSSTHLLAHMQAQSHIPHVANTHFQTRFGHLVTYGAGYYGYLWCQVFAGDIWSQMFASNCLSRAQGERLWKELLFHGGARDPNVMLRSLLGRDSSVESFLQTMQ